ncbi:MAG: PQQ-binding-like beta-propeller repeat protein [Gemmataceae bacterium]
MRRIGCLALACFALSAPAEAPGEANWPAFLGGARSGAAAPSLPTAWNATQNVRWKADLPGSGWSSPVVWGNRVFLTTAVSGEALPEPMKGLYISNLQGKLPGGEHEWRLVCLDADTGKMLWNQLAFRGPASSTIHIKNSLASETPVTDGKHVWAYFGNVGIACFDLDGKLIWKEKTPVHKTRMGWGTAASPILHDGQLFVVHDNEEKSFLMALDAATGKTRWRVERREGSNWGTPYLWKNSLRTELVTAGTDRVRSYGLDGKLLWEFRGMSVVSIPTPFAVGDLLYVTSGYVLDPVRKPVYAIKPGASGDITLGLGQSSSEHIAWVQWKAGPYHPTPVVHDGLLYILHDRGFIACYDALTGKEIYSKRIGGGASRFTASPWAYAGKLFCLSEDGVTYVLQTGKEYRFVGRNELDEMALATPAIANGNLFIRTQSKLYCLRNPGS